MKKVALALATAMVLAPTIASASYMCDKRFGEIHGQNCPAGSSWDSGYHACIVNGS